MNFRNGEGDAAGALDAGERQRIRRRAGRHEEDGDFALEISEKRASTHDGRDRWCRKRRRNRRIPQQALGNGTVGTAQLSETKIMENATGKNGGGGGFGWELNQKLHGIKRLGRNPSQR